MTKASTESMTEASTALLTYALHGEIAVVTVDNPPVNAISAQLRSELWAMVDTLDADPAVAAVVLACAGRTFIAGADVKEFGQAPIPPHLPDLIDHLEQAAKPWTAAIHGSALGGGLEIALGCAHRVAVASAKLGLPEVTLGVMPGASGTVRTPRLVGLDAAVDLVVTGRPISAQKAQDIGLVDQIIEGDLVEQAIEVARQSLTSARPTPISQRAIEPVAEDFWATAQKLAAKAGHAAPVRALQSLKFASENTFAEAMKQEREGFLDLRSSDQAAALRAVFFAERAAPRPACVKGITPRAITRVGVVGGGTMGAGIASACRSAGLPVVLIERDDDALSRGIANIDSTFAGAVKRGKISCEQHQSLINGVQGATDYEALADCDLVIEAVFEQIDVKRDVFTQLDQNCRADAILATNTSYLDPSEIFVGLSNPERYIGLHFFSPAHIMKLLEIVPVAETAPDVLAAAFDFAKKLKKMPVRAGICEGFIGNRILKRYRAEAENLVKSGIAIADVDAAMRQFGLRMGPFEAQDLGGLDIAYLQREGARAAGQTVPETLGDILVRAGRKGQKTSGGWYDYHAGDRKPVVSSAVAGLLADQISAGAPMSAAQIAEHLVGAMANEGQAILDEGIATSATDIDLVKIHGYGFPRWKGGPMHWAAAQ